ncbi:3-hydroxyacyl-ACP dehydratase FabZ family protein [Streptomyces sp. NPDC018031]|uniref:3-hydroxyacyl-ACP dehydratase FabZ family protein n=1 Tax=Streptomyces sp. NPDC018031 TaxID=3365033 RepID=UPI00378C41BC
MYGTHAFKQMLPHRYPMLLVDRITELVPGERARGLKAVTVNEPWYAHVPDDAGPEDYHYPSPILLESWCHVAGYLVGRDSPNPDVLTGQAMLLGGVADIEFLRPVLPGDVVEHRVTLSRVVGETFVFEGDSTVGDEPAMTVGRLVMTMRPASELPQAAPSGRPD